MAAGLAAAVAAAATGMPLRQPDRPGSAAAVALAAVVTPGSATNWNAAGIDTFYGIDWNARYGPTVVAPFHLLRDWIQVDGIDAALKSNPEPNLVLSSGRGAGNASALISAYLHSGDPTLLSTRWILDNNIDRPNGGYATRLPFFALVAVNPVPTPTDTGARILDVGYEYAWNSDVPLYVGNLLSLLNSITEYAYRYGRQNSVTLPPEVLVPDPAPGHYIVDTQGAVSFQELSADNTTVYVTYQADGLAMLRPIRDLFGLPGRVIADLVEPALTVIVDAGYPDNNPMSPPDVYTPMRLLPSPTVMLTALGQLPGAIAQGIAAAGKDLENACTPKASASTVAAPRISAPRPAKRQNPGSRTPRAIGADRPGTSLAHRSGPAVTLNSTSASSR